MFRNELIFRNLEGLLSIKTVIDSILNDILFGAIRRLGVSNHHLIIYMPQ